MILLVSVSARMLAELAVGDGYDVVAFDRFGDLDLQRLCPSVSVLRDLGGRGGMAALVDAAEEIRAAERRLRRRAGEPARARRAAGRGPHAARVQPGDAPARARPRRCSALRCARRASPIRDASGRRRAAAGGPLAPLAAQAGARRRRPRRARVARRARWRATSSCRSASTGSPCSAAAVANGRSAVVLGLSEQLVGLRALGGRGYAWCGNVVPPRLPASSSAR